MKASMRSSRASRLASAAAAGASLSAALLWGCASSPAPAAASRLPDSAAPSTEPDARAAATEHFYRGKALALAGEPACARQEFQAALETFRAAARSGAGDDLEFGAQLYESVALYDRRAAASEKAPDDRPPAENSKDSLVAQPPSARPEEIAAAQKEVQESAESAAAPSFDIPVVVNEKVLRAVAFYQFRTPHAFAAALQRSGRYLPLMRGILKDAGLPEDLVYVAMVESAFKCTAHSRKAAHGFWQFIDGTARRYGLRKTREIDERSDPVKSTKAAAAYFRDLYEMFGDWHLAMAAYDTGEGRVLRALQATGARDYWELSASEGALHRETRDYVPFILAAALIAHDPAKFGFDVVPDPALAFDVAELDKRIDLAAVARVTGTTLEEIQTLNGELRQRSTPKGRYALRVPAGTASALLDSLPRLPAARETVERRVTVRKGDTLARIAKRVHVSVEDLCEWNDLSPDARPRRGAVLVVPTKGASRPDATLAAATPRETVRGEIRAIPTPGSAITSASQIGDVGRMTPASAASPLPSRYEIPASGFTPARAPAPGDAEPAKTAETQKKVVYTVRPGDTLFRIAQTHGLTVDAIRRTNRLRRRDVLEAGRRLTLVLAAAR